MATTPANKLRGAECGKMFTPAGGYVATARPVWRCSKCGPQSEMFAQAESGPTLPPELVEEFLTNLVIE